MYCVLYNLLSIYCKMYSKFWLCSFLALSCIVSNFKHGQGDYKENQRFASRDIYYQNVKFPTTRSVKFFLYKVKNKREKGSKIKWFILFYLQYLREQGYHQTQDEREQIHGVSSFSPTREHLRSHSFIYLFNI